MDYWDPPRICEGLNVAAPLVSLLRKIKQPLKKVSVNCNQSISRSSLFGQENKNSNSHKKLNRMKYNIKKLSQMSLKKWHEIAGFLYKNDEPKEDCKAISLTTQDKLAIKNYKIT